MERDKVNVYIARGIYGICHAVNSLWCLIHLGPLEFQSMKGWIVPKLSEYVKVAEASEILGVFLETVRTWGADVKIVMHRVHKVREFLHLLLNGAGK
jgi:hypothetical protein